MRYQRVKNVAWRRVGAETVIVNLGRRRMLAVNEAGGAVWDALAEGASRMSGDVAPFLADLEEEGVVECVATDEAGPSLPMPPGSAPTVVWREELNHFGGCSFTGGESDICNSNANVS